MEHGTGVSIFKINRLEMENSVIVRDSIEDILQDRYKNIRKLELMDKDENIRVFRQKTGDLCFIGEYKKTPVWKNLFTGETINNRISADYEGFISYENVKYVNYYVSDEPVSDDLVIYIKAKNDIEGSDIYIDIINREFVEVVGGSLEECRVLRPKLNDMSPVRDIKIAMYNILYKKNIFSIRNYKAGYTDEKIESRVLLSKDENFVAYMGKSILCNEYKYVNNSDGEKVLLCSCYSHIESAEADISGLVEILKPEGYIYVKPFVVDKEVADAKIICVANRKIELEYYDDKSDEWKSFHDLKNYVVEKKLQLRAPVKYGDKIKGIMLVS